MPTILRRLLLWTVICAVSAAPSFAVAAQGFDRPAMIVGVCLFIAAYTLFTSTESFERFHRRPFVRSTLYTGYIVRMAISILFPLGMGADIMPGVLSIEIVTGIGLDTKTFAGTLLTTCVQGTLLNIILFVFMLIVYAFQRAFRKPPVEMTRGFAVIPIATVAQPVEDASPRRRSAD